MPRDDADWSSWPGLSRLRAEAKVFSASRNNPSAGEGPAIPIMLASRAHLSEMPATSAGMTSF
jgi:hypothetical protein